jgi:methionyl-tRNA synthetase
MSMHPTPEQMASLQKALADAVASARACMDDAIEAFDKAEMAKSTNAAHIFAQQSNRALIAYEAWRIAADNLQQAIARSA